MSETRQLCEFVAGLTYEKVPSDLVDLAKLCILDLIGVAIYGSRKQWSQIIAAQGRRVGSAPLCTVFAADWKASPEIASLVNGSMGHSFEYDDGHDESLLHPGAVVIPAAMAVAEANQCSGRDFLIGVIIGYEVMTRVGLAVGSTSHILRGFQPTGMNGTFGAAAAACKLLRQNPDQIVYAMGIAGSLSSGIMEYTQTGGMVKRLHAGRAAEGGVLAASLSRDGFTGPTTIFEGKYGFCRVFTNASEMHRLTEGLGSRYALREITVKPYACCSDMFPTIDALLEIKEKHTIDPKLVESVLVEGTEKMAEQNALDGTTSILAAQFSVPFTVAVTLLYDIKDPRIYQEEVLKSSTIQVLSSKVELRKDREFTALYPRTIGSRVTVRLRDGKQYSATVYNAKGSPKNPMSRTEIEDKFMRLTCGILPNGYSEKVRDIVANLESVPNVVKLTCFLGGYEKR